MENPINFAQRLKRYQQGALDYFPSADGKQERFVPGSDSAVVER